ncbi:MAG: endonuclease/exonuclease/phosphatase family protein [Lentisphaerae bacterium]|nr:endonuclease/exonuclease/phosphatase family protein [Lentisphaerota bacterium]
MRHQSRTTRLVIAALLAGLCLSGTPAPAETNPPALTLATWNVENLFDAVDDPQNEGDDPFTPAGWRHWTGERYGMKLGHLAAVIAGLDADILCLQEIENRRSLDDLATVLREEFGCDYPHIVHREGPDHRGIDVALLSRIPAAGARWITPVEAQRDILIVRFAPPPAPLTVCVNHWKSRWGSAARSTRMRHAQARALRDDINRSLTTNAAAAIAVAGDFNDDADGPALAEHLQCTGDPEALFADPTGTLLYSLHAALPDAGAGTCYYRNGDTWNSFDQICVSRAMLPGYALPDGQTGWRVVPESYEVVRPTGMTDPLGRPIPFRPGTDPATGARVYLTGCSDHFPVRVRLTAR